jgi:hypothetical protein
LETSLLVADVDCDANNGNTDLHDRSIVVNDVVTAHAAHFVEQDAGPMVLVLTGTPGRPKVTW